MGTSGVTEQEAKMILKALIPLQEKTKKSQPTPAPQSKSINSYEKSFWTQIYF